MPARTHASIEDLFGFGARSGALAGAGASVVDGYDACYENPAGLAGVRTRHLTVGYQYGKFLLEFDRYADPNTQDMHASVVGAQLPVPFRGALQDRVGLGIAFLAPYGVIARAHVPASDKPIMVLLDDRTQVVAVEVAAGLRLSRRFDVGAGVLALAALVGDINIEADPSGRIGARSEQQLVADYAPIFGVTLHLDEGDIALVYRGVSAAGYDVTISNNLLDQLPIGLPQLRLHGVAQYDPRQVTLEAAWHTLPRIRVLTGVTWKRWSDYPGLADVPSARSRPLPHAIYGDTFTGRIAAERLVGEHGVLRLGYAYEPTPVTTPEYVVEYDSNRHVFGIGFGLSYAPFQLDLFGQWHVLEREAHSGGNVFTTGLTLGVDLQ